MAPTDVHQPVEPTHEVFDVQHGPGELSFGARIGERSGRVYFRTDAERPTSPEAVLPSCLLPAMRFGGTLRVPVPLSPRLLRDQREFQALQIAWSRGWDYGDPLHEVLVEAPQDDPEPTRGNGRVAAFLSLGGDSWSTVLDHDELTDLIFVRGVDLLPGEERHDRVLPTVEARVREVADALSLDLHVVETNVRQLTDPLASWEIFFSCALDAVALFLGPRFERVLIAGSTDHEIQQPWGGQRMVDNLWSTERLEIREDGGRYTRFERIARISRHPLVRRTLRICWQNPDGAYNCGRCRKCISAMTILEIAGALETVDTFPSELDLDAVATITPQQTLSLAGWEDMLDAVREGGRRDLEPAIESVVENGRRHFGLPRSYRARSLPGPPPLSPKPEPEPAAPDAERMLAEVLESRSWKLTAPLRRVGRVLRRAAAMGGRRRRRRRAPGQR